MFSQDKPDSYYGQVNEPLLRAVPQSAEVILDVGCGSGELGARLKQIDPRRKVFGVERDLGGQGRV